MSSMTKLISQRDKFLNKNKTEKWEIKQAAASNLSSAPTLKNNPYKRNSEIYVPRVKIMNTDHNRRQHSNKIINNNVQYIFYKRTHKSKEKLGIWIKFLVSFYWGDLLVKNSTTNQQIDNIRAEWPDVKVITDLSLFLFFYFVKYLSVKFPFRSSKLPFLSP